MHDSTFHWFENAIDDGAAILNFFKASATSNQTKLITRTAKTILSIIRKAGAVKHGKSDFRMLGKDAALLAAAFYRMAALKPYQQEQRGVNLQDMVSTLSSIEDFIESSIQRTGISQVVSAQADRKRIERHRKRIADILLKLEFSFLAQSASTINEDSRYHVIEPPSFTRGPKCLHPQPFLERPTTGAEAALDDKPPFAVNSVDSPSFSHHDCHRPTHVPPSDQCPFHLCVGTQKTIGIPLSLAPNTINVYDHSQNTTYHGSHNYQGQSVNQGCSSHGPVGMPPQNVYVKHFGNEIYCWSPSSDDYDPVPSSAFNPQGSLYQPEFDVASSISGASLGLGGS